MSRSLKARIDSAKHTLARMTNAPETRYAKSGDISIAYQVVGDGPLDLVMVPGWISHLDLQWEDPSYRGWVERLASFCRVILFDKRGTGLSDRDVGDSTLEERMDDLRAVMEAAGSQRAAVHGLSEGGALSMLFAATYPERVQALILCATFPRVVEAPDFPEGAQIGASLDELARIIETSWGEGKLLPRMAPSLKDVEASQQYMKRFERAALSPRAARANLRWIYEIDVRPVARALRVPTLVLHRDGDLTVPVVGGRWLGRNVPNARYFEQRGADHAPWVEDALALVDEIQVFLTGSRGEVDADRVLATVLFTDIVNSTDHLTKLGDGRWKDLLVRHQALVREQLTRFRGQEVNTIGDGFIATFDGPARAIRCATAIRDSTRAFGIEVRAGVHTGECERKGNDIAVHTAARVLSHADPSEVLVSSTVRDLVAGSAIEFRDRGSHSLKGIAGEWRLFAAQ